MRPTFFNFARASKVTFCRICMGNDGRICNHAVLYRFYKTVDEQRYSPGSPYTITFRVRLLTFKNLFNAKRCILSTTFKSASKPQTLAP